jgi:hypothetical protein
MKKLFTKEARQDFWYYIMFIVNVVLVASLITLPILAIECLLFFFLSADIVIATMVITGLVSATASAIIMIINLVGREIAHLQGVKDKQKHRWLFTREDFRRVGKESKQEARLMFRWFVNAELVVILIVYALYYASRFLLSLLPNESLADWVRFIADIFFIGTVAPLAVIWLIKAVKFGNKLEKELK